MSWIKIYSDTRDHLGQWLENYQKAQDVAPAVQEMHDEMDWVVRIAERCPPKATSGVSSESLDVYAKGVSERVTSQVQMIPSIDPTGLTWASSGTATSSDLVLAHVAAIVDAMSRREIPGYESLASEALSEKRKLQDFHHRPERVRALLAAKLPDTVAKFDAALKAYQSHKSGGGTETAAALEMRTFLEHFYGELIDRARQHPKEQRIKDEMVLQRLFSSAPTLTDVTQQFALRKTLHDELSGKAKRRPLSPDISADDFWTRVLDYALVVASALPD